MNRHQSASINLYLIRSADRGLKGSADNGLKAGATVNTAYCTFIYLFIRLKTYLNDIVCSVCFH